MFKEQGSFWIYFAGLIIMFLVIFFIFQSYSQKGVFSSVSDPVPVSTNKFANTVTPRPTQKPTTLVTQNNVNIDITKEYTANIVTNIGTLGIQLYAKSAPNTVANFINLANSKYYDGTKFYKLIPSVMLQGGSDKTKNDDPLDDVYGNPGYTIPDEINWDSLDFSFELRSQLYIKGYRSTKILASKDIEKYSIMMASPGPNRAGSQFIILLTDISNPLVNDLRGRGTVFAKSDSNSEAILERISVMPVDNNISSPRPIDEIIIKEIKVYSK